MSKIIYLLVAIICSITCFGQNSKLPCHGPEYSNTKTHFHAAGIGSGSDMNIARTEALANVHTNLTSNILAIGDSVNTAYADNNTGMKHRLNQIWARAISWDVKYAYNECNKVAVDPDGVTMHSYQSLQLAREKVIDAVIDEIKSNKDLGPDFDYEKFKTLFNQEMDKF